MSTNERLLSPIQTPAEFPRLEMRDGQFMFSMTNHEGGRVERFISPAAVKEAFSGIAIDTGWLRPELVRWGNGKVGEWAVVFFMPATHDLEITREAGVNTDWKITSEVDRIKTPLPGLVFFGIQSEYYIWAVKTYRLDPHQEVYRCPLPNVEVDGKICWGPFKPPRCSAKSIFEAFELFIKSTFNNHRANGKSKAHKEDVRVLLRELAKANEEAEDDVSKTVFYPTDDLMRQVEHTGVTLDQAIRGFFDSGEMPQ